MKKLLIMGLFFILLSCSFVRVTAKENMSVKKEDYTNFDFVSKMRETSDGGYIAVGYIEQQNVRESDYILLKIRIYDAYIIKYNQDMEKEWQQYYRSSYSDQFFSVDELSDGSFVAVGVTFESAFNNQTNKHEHLIVKYDALGNEVFKVKEVRMKQNIYTRLLDVKATNDGGFVTTSSDNIEPSVNKYNQSGAKIWTYDFPSDQFYRSTYTMSSIVRLDDGSFVVAGKVTDWRNQNETVGMIYKISQEGHLLWKKEVDFKTISSIILSSTNKIIGIGRGVRQDNQCRDSIDLYSNNIGCSEGVIFQLNHDTAKIEWEKYYDNNYSWHYFYNTVVEYGNRYIVGGYYLNSKNKTPDENRDHYTTAFDPTITNVLDQPTGLIIAFDNKGKPIESIEIKGSFVTSIVPYKDTLYISGSILESLDHNESNWSNSKAFYTDFIYYVLDESDFEDIKINRFKLHPLFYYTFWMLGFFTIACSIYVVKKRKN